MERKGKENNKRASRFIWAFSFPFHFFTFINPITSHHFKVFILSTQPSSRTFTFHICSYSMTNTNMALDDADTIQRFITQMKVQTENSNPTETHEPEKPMTPPPIDPDHLTSPGAHPKPSPHISGLTAPYNTPHLTAAQIHNQNVADAFSDYVNAMDGRPLSESIWAPAAGFVRHVPSTPHGARSALGLTRSKAVEPNSATNESFARMSFKAADPVDSAGKKWSSDRSANAIFPHVSPSFGPDTPASTDMVKKENEAPAKSKGYLPPHLRATRVSSPKSDAITRAPAHDKSNSSDQNLVSSESPVKTKTSLPDPEGFSSKVTSNFSNPSPIKNTVQDTITKITTGPAGAKPSTDTSAAGEDLEHKTFFTSWPKLEERTRPGMLSHILLFQ